MESLEFHLERSRFLSGLLIGLYGLGGLAILYSEIDFGFQVLLYGYGLYSFWKTWRIHISRRAKETVLKIWRDARGGFGFETRKGQRYKAKVLADTFKSRWIIILRFKTASRIFNVLVPWDALKQNEYRLLWMGLNSV